MQEKKNFFTICQYLSVSLSYYAQSFKGIILNAMAKRAINDKQILHIARRRTQAYCRMARTPTMLCVKYAVRYAWFAVAFSIYVRANGVRPLHDCESLSRSSLYALQSCCSPYIRVLWGYSHVCRLKYSRENNSSLSPYCADTGKLYTW